MNNYLRQLDEEVGCALIVLYFIELQKEIY